jgi:hypothetical protein
VAADITADASATHTRMAKTLHGTVQTTEAVSVQTAAVISPTGRAAVTIGPQPVLVVPARYVLLCLAATLTGYTIKAMERKIERGDWTEGKVWRRAPDGRILIDLLGYQKWVEGQ